MTEKQYGGLTGRGLKEIKINAKSQKTGIKISNKSGMDKEIEKESFKELNTSTEKILKAGEITKHVRSYARTIVKKDMPLLEIAEKIEAKIIELGGKPAFPVNLSIDRIAAHYTPTYDDKTLASGLIKIDFGVHIDGFLVDNSLSLDLENSEENKKLITASEKALENAIKLIKTKIEKKEDLKLSEIGKTIQETIESFGFSPVINLSGHSIERYNLHAGITVPNIDDKKDIKIHDGIYAIEPFATNGSGKIHEGAISGIYELENKKPPRSNTARKVLDFILQEYNTLPFCSRWIFRKLGASGLIGLKELEANGNLHSFHQLVESSSSSNAGGTTKVGQAEHTIIIEKGKVIVATE